VHGGLAFEARADTGGGGMGLRGLTPKPGGRHQPESYIGTRYEVQLMYPKSFKPQRRHLGLVNKRVSIEI